MAMAVAENAITVPAQQAPRREANLGLASLVGGILLLAGLGLVFGALPVVWHDVLPTQNMNEFLSAAVLLIIGIAALVAVGYVFYALDRAFHRPGVRAGAIVEAVLLFLVATIVFSVGNSVSQDSAGMAVTVLLAGALLAGLVWLSSRAFFATQLLTLEEQGWFYGTFFKRNQGVLVRRYSLLGVLVIAVSGIITMTSHGLLGAARTGTGDWYWYVPFTDQHLYVPLLFRVNILGPLILLCLALWFGWRLVNWPVFADFLIATEAEMNKVSWTTRRRLVQDTIVVLVTVVLLTGFLFGIDIVWFKILNSPWVHVLQVNLKAEQQKQQEKTQW